MNLFEQAIALNPLSPQSHNNMANVLANMGKGIEALAQYDRAVELEPQYAEAFNNRGMLLRNLKKIGRAHV